MQSQRDAETHLQFRNIITKGQINEKSEDDISNIINSLKDHQPWLHELSVDDIIEYYDKLFNSLNLIQIISKHYCFVVVLKIIQLI